MSIKFRGRMYDVVEQDARGFTVRKADGSTMWLRAERVTVVTEPNS